MHYNFRLDELVLFFAMGAILMVAIYHTNLFYFNRQKILANYSLYLWVALSYLIEAYITSSYNSHQMRYPAGVLSTIFFFCSLLLYLKFIYTSVVTNDLRNNFFILVSKKIWLLSPFFIIFHNSELFLPKSTVKYMQASAFVLDGFLVVVLTGLAFFILKERTARYHIYMVIGTFSFLFFNSFASIAYNTHRHLVSLSYISYIAIGYCIDVIFFSLAVSQKMRSDTEDKYLALTDAHNQHFALELEKQKAHNILTIHTNELQTERLNTIMEQRQLIGRKLHDGLSGSLVTLRLLVRDYKTKATNHSEKVKFEDLEAEIDNIYKETRNYSHELSRNTEVADSEMAYDIMDYLKKLEEQFSTIGLLNIYIAINAEELTHKLNALQTKHLFFLLKECITNTIKHSNAQNIWINIKFNKKECLTHISDDGQGFNALAVEGVGIKGMRARIDDLKGSLKISTNNGETMVSICFEVDGG